MKAFRTVLPYLRKNIWFLVCGLAALLAVDFLQLIIPQIIKVVIDDLTQEGAKSRTLLLYGLEIVGIAILIGIFRFAWRYLILGTAHRIEQNLRLRLFTHLQALPLNFFNRFSIGDIMAHATNDMNAIRMALGMALVALVDGVILSLMTVGFMTHINLRLTMYALIPAPFLIFITNRVSKSVHERFLKIQETFSLLTEKVRENIAGIRVVKSYVKENHRLQNFQETSNRLVRRNMELIRVWGLFFPLLLGIINLSLAIILIFGGRQTILLTITPGDFVAFTSYLGILTWPLIALGWVMNIFQRGAASMKRINTLLETRPEITNASHPGRISRVTGKIEFRNLSFSYDGRFSVLKNINLTINPGETVAFVGRVGTGKTTIINLLLGLYAAKKGSIFIDGRDIQSIPLESLRQSIGYVPQDTFLFADTINENIRFGSPLASQEKIAAVSRIAMIYDEIMTFPRQFETVVGEKGITLSGGQKQRIAIARSLLPDNPILIFDNCLSSVDAQTEELLLRNLKPLVAEKTTIIVTHRISSIRNADCIYVFDDGGIREQGDHKTLLNLGGLYCEMFRRQQIEEELEENNSREAVEHEK